MQQRRSNRDRSDATTAALLAAARRSFVDKGFAATSTVDLAEAVCMTRGALYHHFADKTALFHAVIVAEHRAVAEAIEAAGGSDAGPIDALLAGVRAYLDAMAQPGRARLLLIEAPAVLGSAEAAAIDAAHAGRTLADGLAAAAAAGDLAPLPVAPLSDLLSAAFDRAALAITDGADPDDWLIVIDALIQGLRRDR